MVLIQVYESKNNNKKKPLQLRGMRAPFGDLVDGRN